MDHRHTPLIGVRVSIKGSGVGTVTDQNGAFSLSVGSNDVLVFNYIGFVTQEVPAEGKETFQVILEEDNYLLGDVVVVGYGTQTRKTLTTSISKVDGDRLYNVPVASIGDALKGKVPGLRVVTANALSGEAPRMLIRGGSSINMSNDPIVIVDGVSRDMSTINPNDADYGNKNFSRANDMNVQRADYLCLRDVSLSYTFPTEMVKRMMLPCYSALPML